jgi:hypothetical protein
MGDLERVACVSRFVAEPAAVLLGQQLVTHCTVSSVVALPP